MNSGIPQGSVLVPLLLLAITCIMLTSVCFCYFSVLIVARRPSSTVVGTPATVTTLASRHTGQNT